MDGNERKEKAVALLSRLTQAHGASGHEGSVRRVVREELAGRSIRTDKTGSIICEKRGGSDRPRVMLAGHLDEVGFMVHSVTKSGLVKFLPLGGWWAHTLPAKRVRILTRDGNEILGVIGAKPPHFLSEAERDRLLKIDDMFIDVGAVGAEDVRERFGIRPGDTIVPESEFVRMHNPDYLLCKAFDNRAGMGLVVQTLKELGEHPNTVVGVGTAQEEVGVRGAQTAVFSVKPDVAIVVEGTPADDMPGIGEDERQGALGRGVQVRLVDPSAINNRDFVRFTLDVAEQCSIPHQVAVRKSGSTDARAIHLFGEGVPTIVLGVPARYIHTHNSIIDVNDFLSALDLVRELLVRLDEPTVKSFTAFDD